MNIDIARLNHTFRDVEFFLLCYCPNSSEFNLKVDDETADQNFRYFTENNYWLITSRSADNNNSLMSQHGMEKILFRGYESDLSVHSYSDPFEKEKLIQPENIKNGVFAYIKYDSEKNRLVVRSDSLGISPLYYRKIGHVYLFASHPSLIHLNNDRVDLISWLSLLQNGFIFGDRSFYEEIQRFPAGSQLTLTKDNVTLSKWFRLETLPAGDAAVDDAAFDAVEAAYQTAIEKCLRLKLSQITLPLSSGYDSRRFFATLHSKGIPFQAVTVQAFHKKKDGYYDIEARCATEIAAAFGVKSHLLPASEGDEAKAEIEYRMRLIGTETFMHEWSVPLMKWLAGQKSSIIYDGLAGDTLGNSGFVYDGLHKDVNNDIKIILNNTLKPDVFNNISVRFPTKNLFTRLYRDHLFSLPNNMNRTEFLFLQDRTRRSISPWITMMHPPGHVVVFPYCDLEFVRETLKYKPNEKYAWLMQKECLRRFYIRYFNFPGSRNLPNDLNPLPSDEADRIEKAHCDFVYSDKVGSLAAIKYFSLPNMMVFILSLFIKNLRKIKNWIIQPLLLLIKTDKSINPYLYL